MSKKCLEDDLLPTGKLSANHTKGVLVHYTYIPFSCGARNCIGLKYAMLSMKIILATIVKNYKIMETVDYKNIEDIDYYFLLVSKARKGYRLKFETRNE
ncbi:hypothetical protein Zmor_012752 [Zophobas morio]|uniref:Cytochrome P450 n=1 Tax=Zophobas morio TaxID=2755281 RepID=A0AA38I9K9_9CUCU|nr:hypothetical protein Zmor_012752 [Zophobas morio]